jgi:hypothetical protein
LCSLDELAASPVVAQVEGKPSERGQSFIERYAHLFKDDADDVQPPHEFTSPVSLTHDYRSNDKADRQLVESNKGLANPGREEDEESIEQYMTKLMQRVRGETSLSPSVRSQPLTVATSAAGGSTTTSDSASAAGTDTPWTGVPSTADSDQHAASDNPGRVRTSPPP